MACRLVCDGDGPSGVEFVPAMGAEEPRVRAGPFLGLPVSRLPEFERFPRAMTEAELEAEIFSQAEIEREQRAFSEFDFFEESGVE